MQQIRASEVSFLARPGRCGNRASRVGSSRSGSHWGSAAWHHPFLRPKGRPARRMGCRASASQGRRALSPYVRRGLRRGTPREARTTIERRQPVTFPRDEKERSRANGIRLFRSIFASGARRAVGNGMSGGIVGSVGACEGPARRWISCGAWSRIAEATDPHSRRDNSFRYVCSSDDHGLLVVT